MITPKNILKHELVGLNVIVCKSANKANVCIPGKVVDETKNMLIIKTLAGIKKFPKDTSEFEFELPDGKVVKIDGKKLVARPEDRLKSKVKKW